MKGCDKAADKVENKGSKEWTTAVRGNRSLPGEE